MNVLLLSKYGRLGASTRLRSLQYLPFLEKEGIRVTIRGLHDDAYLTRLYAGMGRRPWQALRAYSRRLSVLMRAREYDLIWIEKEIFPWAPAWAEAALRRLGVPYVVDYDDAIFHNYDRNGNALVRLLLGRKIDRVMKGASHVFAGNRYIAERAKIAGAANIEIIPTSIDLSKYSASESADGGPVRIGWIGTPVTAKYLRMINSAIIRAGKVSDIKVVLVGASGGGFGSVPVETLKWEEATEAEAIAGFDVGVMPLPDQPWEKGKCGYKLLQYMACGKPVVASPVGVNAEIVKPGINGYLASTEEEWVNAFQALCRTSSLRRELGREGRKLVESDYSIEVSGPRLAKAMRSAVHSGPDRRGK